MAHSGPTEVPVVVSDCSPDVQNTGGGPVGVGIATGNAVRLSLIIVVVITFLISLAVYAASGNFTLSGSRFVSASRG